MKKRARPSWMLKSNYENVAFVRARKAFECLGVELDAAHADKEVDALSDRRSVTLERLLNARAQSFDNMIVKIESYFRFFGTPQHLEAYEILAPLIEDMRHLKTQYERIELPKPVRRRRAPKPRGEGGEKVVRLVTPSTPSAGP